MSQLPAPSQRSEIDPDFILYTDGSGISNFGGRAVLGISHKYHTVLSAFGGSFGTTVPREEFHALLSGLERVWSWWCDLGRAKGCMLPMPVVEWVTDCKHLADAMTRRPDGIGTINKRDSNLDLWASLEWFESRITIIPKFVPRDTDALQKEADMVASELFTMIREYGKQLYLEWCEPAVLNDKYLTVCAPN